MLLRATIVILVMLNLGAAGWWLLRPVVASATATAPAASHPASSGFITARTAITSMATPPLAPAVHKRDDAVGATGDGE